MIQELGMRGLELVQLAQREYVLTQIEKQKLIEMRSNKEWRDHDRLGRPRFT